MIFIIFKILRLHLQALYVLPHLFLDYSSYLSRLVILPPSHQSMGFLYRIGRFNFFDMNGKKNCINIIVRDI